MDNTQLSYIIGLFENKTQYKANIERLNALLAELKVSQKKLINSHGNLEDCIEVLRDMAHYTNKDFSLRFIVGEILEAVMNSLEDKKRCYLKELNKCKENLSKIQITK